MEDYNCFRNKITWFTFVLSILVVWAHSANWELFLGQTAAAEKVGMLERFLGSTVGQIAVPGFFMMSGYLFYRNFDWSQLGRKWNSRIRSILVPFLLWNGIYYMGYVIGSRLPVVSDIVEKGKVPFDWYVAVEALFHYTYNYVFWYLYQLILLIVLAPVLYGILKKPAVGGVALVISFYLAWSGTVIPHLNLDALFYYSLAAFAGLHGRKIVEGRRTKNKITAGIGLVVLALLIMIIWWPGRAGTKVAFRSLMPVGLWLLVPEEGLIEAKEWMKYNFFLYAVHFALVRLINKTAARFFKGPWLLPVVLFLIMPALMVCFSSGAGSRFKKRWPRIWGLLNGGR